MNLPAETMMESGWERAFSPANRPKVYRFAPVMRGDAGLVAKLQAVIERQAVQIERLEQLAAHDRLTGVLNWLGLERELNRTFYDHSRYGHDAAVILLDLNGFKPINDTYGHAAGDAVLAHVAALLQDSVRSSDIVARMGGDEFVLILKECDEVAMAAKLDQLKARITDTPCRWQGMNLWVSVSLGGATVRECVGVKDILATADARMYARKHK